MNGLIEWVDPKTLRANPANPNIHSPEQIKRLAKLITHYGWRHPIILSKQSGLVVVGHGRLLAALKMGTATVPVHAQDFETPDQEYGFMVSDNAVASWAELDMAQINIEVPSLGPDFDLELLGFKEFKLDLCEDAESKKKKQIRTCPHCGGSL